MNMSGELVSVNYEHVSLVIMNTKESFGYIFAMWQEYS
jgi:hypothetical protein